MRIMWLSENGIAFENLVYTSIYSVPKQGGQRVGEMKVNWKVQMMVNRTNRSSNHSFEKIGTLLDDHDTSQKSKFY